MRSKGLEKSATEHQGSGLQADVLKGEQYLIEDLGEALEAHAEMWSQTTWVTSQLSRQT